ncbi:hypothetical protein ACFWWC_42920 [Streptomyces sp. NPDC058642]|uniref:MmyB family transcriptional regulator n=1 Tax=Streptomyces sp. NPDC058642 TaxID=3346572 RepID=UPI003646F776
MRGQGGEPLPHVQGACPRHRRRTACRGPGAGPHRSSATRWGTDEVRHNGTGSGRFHHHAVGDLTLVYEGPGTTADPGLTLAISTPPSPDSPPWSEPRHPNPVIRR